MQLEKMAETAEEQEHQAWCELPFRQLAYNFAANTFGEESADTMSSANNLILVLGQTGFATKAQQIGKDLLEKKEKKNWQRPLKRSHNFGKSGQCAWRPG